MKMRIYIMGTIIGTIMAQCQSKANIVNVLSPLLVWSGRLDSNQRPLEPHSSALSQAALRPENEDLYIHMSLKESYIKMYKF